MSSLVNTAKNFSSILGYRADRTLPEAIAYIPHNSPLLLVTDSTTQQSSAMLQKVSEDVLIAGWNVLDFSDHAAYTEHTPYPDGGTYHHNGTANSDVLAVLQQLLEDVEQRVRNMLQEHEDTVADDPLYTFIVLENLQQYSRKDKKAILSIVCRLLRFAGVVHLGVVLSSSTPQVYAIEKYGIEYIDVRFDKNSFHSAYPLTDDQRYILSQLKRSERFAYVRLSRSEESVVVRPSTL